MGPHGRLCGSRVSGGDCLGDGLVLVDTPLPIPAVLNDSEEVHVTIRLTVGLDNEGVTGGLDDGEMEAAVMGNHGLTDGGRLSVKRCDLSLQGVSWVAEPLGGGNSCSPRLKEKAKLKERSNPVGVQHLCRGVALIGHRDKKVVPLKKPQCLSNRSRRYPQLVGNLHDINPCRGRKTVVNNPLTQNLIHLIGTELSGRRRGGFRHGSIVSKKSPRTRGDRVRKNV